MSFTLLGEYMNRYTAIYFLTGVLLSICNLQAATYTVSKNGTGQFTSVQAAINAAGADGSSSGDEVVILDTATYEEQVTIDSSCSGLTVRSSNPKSLRKPVIR